MPFEASLWWVRPDNLNSVLILIQARKPNFVSRKTKASKRYVLYPNGEIVNEMNTLPGHVCTCFRCLVTSIQKGCTGSKRRRILQLPFPKRAGKRFKHFFHDGLVSLDIYRFSWYRFWFVYRRQSYWLSRISSFGPHWRSLDVAFMRAVAAGHVSSHGKLKIFHFTLQH